MPTMKSVHTGAPGTVTVADVEVPVPGPRDALMRVRGDRVVVNPQAAPSGIIGCGGAHGGMAEYLLIEDAVAGRSVAVLPEAVPFDVAALNEPMAVARHCVNRAQVRPADRAVVFGAGPCAEVPRQVTAGDQNTQTATEDSGNAADLR
jgi:(R,R)-butanediol dehydrogenase / meso-butanediol dehydrogenase / diacetyl reductase